MEQYKLFDANGIFAESEHYLLRRIQSEDVPYYRKLATGDLPDSLQSVLSLAAADSTWTYLLENDHLICSIVTKDMQTFCGFCQLQYLDSPTPEMGIDLLPAFQKMGIAPEVLPAFMAQAKILLPIDYFYSKVRKNNLPSQKLAEKLGGICMGTKSLLPADFPKELAAFAEKEFPDLFYFEYQFMK